MREGSCSPIQGSHLSPAPCFSVELTNMTLCGRDLGYGGEGREREGEGGRGRERDGEGEALIHTYDVKYISLCNPKYDV